MNSYLLSSHTGEEWGSKVRWKGVAPASPDAILTLFRAKAEFFGLPKVGLRFLMMRQERKNVTLLSFCRVDDPNSMIFLRLELCK